MDGEHGHLGTHIQMSLSLVFFNLLYLLSYFVSYCSYLVSPCGNVGLYNCLCSCFVSSCTNFVFLYFCFLSLCVNCVGFLLVVTHVMQLCLCTKHTVNVFVPVTPLSF